MKIAWMSDLDIKGSGYMNLSIPLCEGLSNLGHEVKCIALNYDGSEHNYNFSLIPTQNVMEGMAIAQNLFNLWQFDVLVMALDIPIQENILVRMKQKPPFKYVGIMPVEADPLCLSWAMALHMMDKQFIISQFGTEECHKVGLTSATHLPIGIDTDVWRLATPEERNKFRNVMGFSEDTFAVLTVADNQERKNLAAGMEAFAEFAKDKPNARYVLVTRENLPIGWRLRDYAVELGMNDKFFIIERGIPFADLWATFVACDVFMMPSKAEGLCVFPDSDVWTVNGKRKIQNIELNEKIFSHTGNTRKVIDTFQRKYDGTIHALYMSYGLPELKLTSGHLIFGAIRIKNQDGINRFKTLEWIPVEKLNKGDYIFYPKVKTDSIDSFYVSEYIQDIFVHDDRIYSIGRNQYESSFRHPNGKSLVDKVDINEDLASFLGYYISEGCFTGEGISFSFHSNEVDYQEEVKSLCDKLFGLSMKIYYRERNRCDMRLYHTLLGKLVAELCGYSSHEKHLPDWAFSMSDNVSWALIRTMFLGDGNYTKKNQWSLRYSTVSKLLAEQLQFLLLKLGVFASLKINEKKPEYTVTIHHPDLIKVPFIDHSEIPEIKKLSSKRIDLDDGYLIPIQDTSTFQYSGYVYNLEIEKDNSYLLAGGVVHNCMPLMEAMAVGLPCIATDACGMKELLADDRGFLIPYNYTYRDPFGNGRRYRIDVKLLIEMLEFVYGDKEEGFRRISKARDYAKTRTWGKCVAVLNDELMKMMDKKDGGN